MTDAPEIVKLKSKQEELFEVEKNVIYRSVTVKHMIDDTGLTDTARVRLLMFWFALMTEVEKQRFKRAMLAPDGKWGRRHMAERADAAAWGEIAREAGADFREYGRRACVFLAKVVY